MGFLPGVFVLRCFAKASGLGKVRQYPQRPAYAARAANAVLGPSPGASRRPLPAKERGEVKKAPLRYLTSPRSLRGEVGMRAKRVIRVRGEAVPSIQRQHLRATPGEEERTYTDAVVTPPSTTMVWPVMKVEASEPR